MKHKKLSDLTKYEGLTVKRKKLTALTRWKSAHRGYTVIPLVKDGVMIGITYEDGRSSFDLTDIRHI